MDGLFVAVVVILGGLALHGYKKGLVRMVFSLAAIFLAAALASWISPYAEEFLRTQTPLHGFVEEKCLEALEAKTKELSQGVGISEEALGAIAQDAAKAGEKLPLEELFGIELPKGARRLFQENLLGEAGSVAEGGRLLEACARQLADMAVQRVAWALSFVVVGILLGIIVHALDILTKLPVIKGMNHLGGAAFGLLQGLALVWGIFFLVTLCQGSESGRQLMASIQGNAFLHFLYENNPFEGLLSLLL